MEKGSPGRADVGLWGRKAGCHVVDRNWVESTACPSGRSTGPQFEIWNLEYDLSSTTVSSDAVSARLYRMEVQYFTARLLGSHAALCLERPRHRHTHTRTPIPHAHAPRHTYTHVRARAHQHNHTHTGGRRGGFSPRIACAARARGGPGVTTAGPGRTE